LSTPLAIYNIHENFLQNTEKGLTTCAAFCDLSKAFDILDHEIFLWKLEHFYGIRGLPRKLLTSYLQDRQQYTVVEGYDKLSGGMSVGRGEQGAFVPLDFKNFRKKGCFFSFELDKPNFITFVPP